MNITTMHLSETQQLSQHHHQQQQRQHFVVQPNHQRHHWSTNTKFNENLGINGNSHHNNLHLSATRLNTGGINVANDSTLGTDNSSHHQLCSIQTWQSTDGIVYSNDSHTSSGVGNNVDACDGNNPTTIIASSSTSSLKNNNEQISMSWSTQASAMSITGSNGGNAVTTTTSLNFKNCSGNINEVRGNKHTGNRQAELGDNMETEAEEKERRKVNDLKILKLATMNLLLKQSFSLSTPGESPYVSALMFFK